MKEILCLANDLQQIVDRVFIRENPTVEKDDYPDFGIGPLKPVGQLKLQSLEKFFEKKSLITPASLKIAIEQLPFRHEQVYEFNDVGTELSELLEKKDIHGGFAWFNYETMSIFYQKLSLVNDHNGDFPNETLIPFIAMGNGDAMCLGAQSERVFYYNCGQDSHEIATSLMSFYHAWSKVMFIGPEFWLLDPMRNEEGLIDPDRPASKALIRFFNRLS